MSVLNTILDNLKTALEGITKSASYNTDVKKVYRLANIPDDVKEHLPALSIVEGEERAVIVGDTNVRFLKDITINGLIKSETDLPDKMTKFIDDVKTLIYGSVDLGTYCLKTRITGMDPHIMDSQKEAIILVGVEIIYYAPVGSF